MPQGQYIRLAVRDRNDNDALLEALSELVVRTNQAALRSGDGL